MSGLTRVSILSSLASAITYTAAGAGAIVRSVQAVLREMRDTPTGYNAKGDGATDDLAAFNALSGRNWFVPSPATSYKLSANWTPAAQDVTIVAAADISFATSHPNYNNLVPYESSPGPLWSQHIISKTYGAGWAGTGNVFQIASYAKAAVTTVPVVALYGQGEATVNGAKAWALNTSGFANAVGSTAISYELNCGVLAGGGTAYGLVIASSGSGAQPENAIQIDANETGAQYKDGIYAHFSPTSARGCITGAVLRIGGAGTETCQRFLYASGVSATSAEVDLPSLLVKATVANSASRLSVQGAASGSAVMVSIDSTQSNVDVNYSSKGTGIVTYTLNATEVFRLRATGLPDGLQVGAGTGEVDLQVRGTSANSDINLLGKGTGGVALFDGGGTTKFKVDTVGIAFFNQARAGRQTVTGSRGGNAALASLISALAAYGLIIDSTTV